MKELLIKTLISRIYNHKKFKLIKAKKKQKDRLHKDQMIKIFGKTRYYLSIWFGSGMLYAFNDKEHKRI